MPENLILSDLKEASSKNMSIMSSHLMAENLGLDSLLREGRETTFNLSAAQEGERTKLSTPFVFGQAEATTVSKLDTISLEADLSHNNLRTTGSAYTAFFDAGTKDAQAKATGWEDIDFQADVKLDSIFGTQDKTPATMRIKDSLKNENRMITFQQESDCKVTLYTTDPKQFDATCNGTAISADGKIYDFTREANFEHSTLTVKSAGKLLGTVETTTQPDPSKTDFEIKVKPAP